MTGFPLLQELLGTTWLLAPLLGGAVVHGLCMKYGWLAFLAQPIDGGWCPGGRPLFGHSKTFRGPVVVAAGAAGVFALQVGPLHRVEVLAAIELVDYATLPGWWLGALAGVAAELAELPNSFTKRRLGIAPGGTGHGPSGVVFFLWDQLDLLLGYWLVFGFAVPLTPGRLALSIVIVGALHPLLTVVGYLLRMRPTPR